MHSRLILPAFINEIYHKCTEDEENEEGDKHVVDGPDVVHLKQLTAEKHKRKWAYVHLHTSPHTLQAAVKLCEP